MTKEPFLHSHAALRNNPHRVTADQVGAIPVADLPNLTPTVLSIVAQNNLLAGDPIIITGYHADSGNTAHFGKVVGLVKSDTSTGFAASVTIQGSFQNSGWTWTAGSPIFLNGTSLSQSPPGTGFIQQIGVAKASDTIYVDLPPPIKL